MSMKLRWHRQVLKMNKYGNLQRVLNLKLNQNTYEEACDQNGNSTVANASLRRELHHLKKLSIRFGTEADGQAWLINNAYKSEEICLLQLLAN
jgi:hypothetical protein